MFTTWSYYLHSTWSYGYFGYDC